MGLANRQHTRCKNLARCVRGIVICVAHLDESIVHVESLDRDRLGACDARRAARNVLGGDRELVRLLVHQDVAARAHKAVVGAVEGGVVRVAARPTHA